MHLKSLLETIVILYLSVALSDKAKRLEWKSQNLNRVCVYECSENFLTEKEK